MFELIKTSGKARRARLSLKHGTVETPIFMPVGTVGSVKSMTNTDMLQMETQILLGNTYHLFLRPGLEVIRAAGGLHSFMGWKKPILTDSGGFQIFSLGKLNKLTENGAHFQSHLDGTRFLLTPELAVEIQETLGSDIHMVLDECTAYPVSHQVAKSSMERSLRWAKRCRETKTKDDLCQFGIVQGSMFSDLRKISIEGLNELGFEGMAMGGLSVGEPKPEMRAMTEYCCDLLPTDKPRYLMGVGTPLDLIESVALGVDMFDCVMPTRNARNGTLFTSVGKVNIKNSTYRLDQGPLDPSCPCYTCTSFSRSYLRHLYASGELTALRLLSLHNLTYYLNLMAEIRTSIENDSFEGLLKHHQALWDR
ncbi:MAG: tRNA guanosine(34) transglycosylase Tgt [Pseudomonadota bacterium]